MQLSSPVITLDNKVPSSHKIWCTLAVHLSDPLPNHIRPDIRLQERWRKKISISTQLRKIVYTVSQNMLVLSSTVVSRYYRWQRQSLKLCISPPTNKSADICGRSWEPLKMTSSNNRYVGNVCNGWCKEVSRDVKRNRCAYFTLSFSLTFPAPSSDIKIT
jgi:hypothetical protein